MFRTPLKDWHRENLVLKPNLNYPDLPRMMWGDEWRGDGEIFCSFKPSRFSMLGINYDTRNPTKHLNEALLCLPCQEYLRRTIAHEFKAFHGHAIVIPFFPQQKTFSQPATFQVTLLFFPNKPMPLETKALTWHKSFFEDFAPIFFWAQPNQWPPTKFSVLFLLTPHCRFVVAIFFLFRTRPTSWSSWTMTWATGRLTPLVVQSIRRPCRNWPLMACFGDVKMAGQPNPPLRYTPPEMRP